MKKFYAKCAFLALILLMTVLFTYHIDTFNVFHWDNLRFTTAEPNKNFVKTQYILHNPSTFNAFIFGSSRVGNIPPDGLPDFLPDGTPLRWYNMTYSEGIPTEHLLTLKTFLENGVRPTMILLGFDNIPMYASIPQHKQQMLRTPYQVYEENKWDFYRAYLMRLPHFPVIREVLLYDADSHSDDRNAFYRFGTFSRNLDFSLATDFQPERFVSSHGSGFTEKSAYKDIEAIASLCRENGIKLIVFTNPIYESTYRASVADGYFDFLKSVASVCEFYNFSTLNNFTTAPRYYFESSHYRPALGLIIEKMLFGTDEERAEIQQNAGDELWGVRVNAENVEFVISKLQRLIASR